MIDVRASIEAALRRRREQRDAIEDLYGDWLQLEESVGILAAAITNSTGIDGSRFREDILALREKIAGRSPDMKAITERFRRETVNIGVIGRARAGKSTLLRTITGLRENVIPTGDNDPTTAARSRIRHAPGQEKAKLTLYTWNEFRDRYLAPLHKDAGCTDPVPATPEQFLACRYRQLLDSSRGRGPGRPTMLNQEYLERLCIAQDSFGSYRDLLTGRERTRTISRLSELEPFVAYPKDKRSKVRPYHAVRDARIYCGFQATDVTDLVLVDLPGAGEAAVDIDRQFLEDLKNEVDVLLQVKCPAPTEAYIGDEDWKILDLSDAAGMGVDRSDFLTFVINDRPGVTDPGAIENVRQQAGEITARNGVQLRIGNVNKLSDVRDQILGPVLEQLALRLAEMDRTAARTQIESALLVADEAAALADRLAAEVGEQARHLPDEGMALKLAAKSLRGAVGRRLRALCDEYDRKAALHAPVQELDQAITAARERLMKWSNDGFGMGSVQAWLTEAEGMMSVDPGETRDDQCTQARRMIREEFGGIDSSIEGAIVRLHVSVADRLRNGGLPAHMVPADGRPLETLRERTGQLPALRSALDDLLGVRTSYGSIFLRVGGPIVKHVRPVYGTIEGQPGSGAPEGSAGGTSGAEASDSGSSFWRTGRALGMLAAQHTGTTGAAGALGAVHPAAATAVAAAQVAAAVVPLAAGHIWRSPYEDDTAAGLHAALMNAFHEAVTQIEDRMRAEATRLTEVLAAAVEQFFDEFVRTPEVDYEWELLCGPVKAELWPELFGSGATDVAAELRRVSDAASSSATAARDIRALAGRMGLSDAGR